MGSFLPSLKEKKRYLAIEILSKEKKKYDFTEISRVIWSAAQRFMGTLGTAKAGIWVIEDKWKQSIQRGIIRVNNKFVDKLRASLALVSKINKDSIIIKSVGVSGILKKAENRYLN